MNSRTISFILRPVNGWRRAIPVILLLLITGTSYLAAQPVGASLESEFNTDFSIRSIEMNEIRSGGPPKDGIPAIDDPEFASLEQNSQGLTDNEMVIAVSSGGVHKIYPLRILIWHEIVNDTIAGTPISVTWCPLCNSALVFGRRVRHEGRSMLLDFGTTGRLRYSNLLMYDRQTESWWQQGSGRALIGELTGLQLEIVPATTMSYQNASRVFPDALILQPPERSSRAYGVNPYRGYDRSSTPLLYEGPELGGEDRRPLERALVVHGPGEEPLILAYHSLREEPFIRLNTNNGTLYVLYDPDARSPLDQGRINTGRQVGTANAFLNKTTTDQKVRIQALGLNTLDTAGGPNGITSDMAEEFALSDETVLIDVISDTVFDANGLGVLGPLSGTRLSPAVSVQHFWFSARLFSNGEDRQGLLD